MNPYLYTGPGGLQHVYPVVDDLPVLHVDVDIDGREARPVVAVLPSPPDVIFNCLVRLVKLLQVFLVPKHDESLGISIIQVKVK